MKKLRSPIARNSINQMENDLRTMNKEDKVSCCEFIQSNTMLHCLL